MYLANKYYDDGQYEFKRLRLNDMVHSCGFSRKEQKAYNRNNCNYQVALYWYTKALKNGKEQARQRLVHMYEKGLGVEKNHELAEYWHRFIPQKDTFGTPCKTNYLPSTYLAQSYIKDDQIIKPSGEKLSLRKIKNLLKAKMSGYEEFIVEMRKYSGKLRTFPFVYFTGDRFHIDYGCFSMTKGPDISLSTSKYDSKVFTSYREFISAAYKAELTEDDICRAYLKPHQ